MTTINSGDSLINNPLPASEVKAPALPTPPKSEFWGKIAQLILHNPSEEAIRSEAEILSKLEPKIPKSTIELMIANIRDCLFKAGKKDIEPLILHAIAGEEEAVSEDLKRPVGDIKDIALLWAAYLGHTQIVPLLLDAGAKLESEAGSPLILTSGSEIFSSERNIQVVRLLLERGCPIDSVDKEGKSALAYAAEGGHLDLVKLLLEHGAKPTRCDLQGVTPLMSAMTSGYTEVARLLIEHGALVNLIQGYNQTLLMVASAKGYIDLVKLLLAKGADVNADTSQFKGWVSALWAAAANGHIEIVKVLLDAGADPGSLDQNGKTILNYVKNQRTPHWQLVRQVIKSHPLFTKEISTNAKHYKQTNIIANVFEIGGVSRRRNKQFEWYSISRELSAITMAQSIRQLAVEYPNLLDEDTARHLGQSLQFAADQISRQAKQNLQRIKSGLPTFILSGYDAHATTYLIWNDLIIICDRGGNSLTPLIIRHYDPNKLDLNVVDKLFHPNQAGITEEEYTNFTKILPTLLDFKEVTNESIVENFTKLPWQKYGNCGWASLEGAIKAYLFINNQKLNPSKTMEELKKETDISFTNWKIFQQFILLEKYFAGELDPRLVSESFVSLRGARSNPAIDTELLQRLDAFEAKYLNHQLAFLEANIDKRGEIQEKLIWFLFLANTSHVIETDLLLRAQALEAKFLSQGTLGENFLYQEAWQAFNHKA